VPPKVHRCPHCHTPVFIGRLGSGTVIEVQCRRKQCRGNYMPFRMIVM